MRRPRYLTLAAAGVTAALLLGATLQASAAEAKKEPTGRELAYNKKKGNCLACHQIPSDPSTRSPDSKNFTATTIGPQLVGMKARFPDKAKLRAQIWDPMVKHPNTVMPPFGAHHILSAKEIDLIVDYVYGL